MTYTSEVLADSPLAWYRLGESSGTTMTDSSGNGRNGTYVGTTLGVAGAVTDGNTAATVTGVVGSRGTVTNGSWMNGGGSGTTISIEAWVKWTGTPTESAFFSRGGGNTTCPYGLHVTGGNIGARFLTNATGGVNTTSGGYNDGNWHHVVLTANIANAPGTELNLYVDGARVVGPSAQAGFTISTSTVDLIMGGRTSAAFFAGSVDECAVYGTELSAARVLAHYTAGVTPATPNVPTSVVATPVNGDQMDLTWMAPASGPAPTGYDTRLNGGAATDRGNTLAYSFTGLTPATSYTLSVRAHNASGSSAWVDVAVTTPAVIVPPAGYVATVAVGSYSWEVASTDPAGYGVIAGLRVGWDARQDDGWPTQHNPTKCSFSILVEDGEDLSDLDIGAHVLVRFYTDDPVTPLAEFGGTIRDLTARPHPSGMVYAVSALDYLQDLAETPLAAFIPNGTPLEKYWNGGSPPTLSGLAMGDANSPPDPFDPPTVPYPGTGSGGSAGADIDVVSTNALDTWTKFAGALAFAQSWDTPDLRALRAIFTPNLDADGIPDTAQPYVATYVAKEANLVEVDAAEVPTDAVEWRRLRDAPNRVDSPDGGLVNERPHPGIATITRIMDQTIVDTVSSWVVLGEEDLPNQWSGVWRLYAHLSPEVVAGWFTLPTAMTTYVSILNIATRHNPSGLDNYAGILAGATLVVGEDRRWWVDFTLRRAVPEGTIPPSTVLWSEVDPALTWTTTDPAITWTDADDLGL